MIKKIIEFCKESLCKHDWEEVSHVKVHEEHEGIRKIDGCYQYVNIVNPYPKGQKWTYRCKKCGAIKVKKNY